MRIVPFPSSIQRNVPKELISTLGIAGLKHWQCFVCEFKKGVTGVNISKRTKILQGYFFCTFFYFSSGILFRFKLFYSLQILKSDNKQREK